ncbi:hypothetical protein BSU04_12830 [Caballeronia sordidicola]|uniref:Uncharacterized protein n=1 Tax=Caballeronia sordidicola TaxID=196367 RepID=A0A226WXE4_CABSO|nr:hypothetical protein BSU04_25215 [Caballeronia sordidicola]OXC78261.1 hypothetical protein BSU04_12830 [Caballeronia sordidicola]
MLNERAQRREVGATVGSGSGQRELLGLVSQAPSPLRRRRRISPQTSF